MADQSIPPQNLPVPNDTPNQGESKTGSSVASDPFRPMASQSPKSTAGKPFDSGILGSEKKSTQSFADEVLKPKEAPRGKPGKGKTNPSPEGLAPEKTQESAESNMGKTGSVNGRAGSSGKGTSLKGALSGQGEDLMRSLSDKQVVSSERKTIIFKILTVILVISFLGGLTIGGVFAYNKWVKPAFNKDSSQNEEKKAEDGTKKENGQSEETKPATTDSDNDSMPDSWEIQYGLNPNDPADAMDDPDFDQLKNNYEYKYGTDLKNPDTDGDGFRDGIEVQGGFNPKGEGKLSGNDSNSGGKDYNDLAGSYKGTMSGSRFGAQDLEFTLEKNGTAIGTFNFKNGDAQIFNRAKGTFTFDNKTKVFTSEVKVKGFLGQEGVDYQLKMNGQSQGQHQISGTWTSTLDREVPWLSNDRGTFSLK